MEFESKNVDVKIIKFFTRVKVKLGVINPYEPGQEAAVIAMHPHPDYNNDTAANDIAILKIDYRNEFGEQVGYLKTGKYFSHTDSPTARLPMI